MNHGTEKLDPNKDEKNGVANNSRLYDSYENDEINLIEIFVILWHQRWFMLLVLGGILGLAMIYCFTAAPLFKISCQLRPGITGFNDKGNPMRDWRVEDIVTYFKHKGNWEGFLHKSENVNPPKITSKIKRGSSVVTLIFYWKDAADGKKLLGEIIDKAQSNVEGEAFRQVLLSRSRIQQAIKAAITNKQHISIERGRVENEIAKSNNKFSLLKAQLESIKQDLLFTKGTLNTLNKSMESIDRNTGDLLKVKKQTIKSDRADKLALLMYSNIIQQNVAYANNLEQRMADLKKQINQYSIQITNKKNEIKSLEIDIGDLVIKRDKELPAKEALLDKQIETLRLKLSVLQPLEVVSPPGSSSRPARPRRVQIVFLAFCAGIMVAILLAFFREFWLKNKEKLVISSK